MNECNDDEDERYKQYPKGDIKRLAFDIWDNAVDPTKLNDFFYQRLQFDDLDETPINGTCNGFRRLDDYVDDQYWLVPNGDPNDPSDIVYGFFGISQWCINYNLTRLEEAVNE